MKATKYLIVFLLLTGFSFTASGQRGYYSSDTIVQSGVKITDRRAKLNSASFQVEINNTTREFLPSQVKEYSIDGRTVYVSRKIQIDGTEKEVFLERLISGKITVYYYPDDNGDTYFLEDQQGRLTELPRTDKDGKSFRETLAEISADCKSSSGSVEFVKYRNRSVTKFFEMYNGCINKPFPRFEYGLVAGLGFLNLYPPADGPYQYLQKGDLNNIIVPTIGIFFDYPVMVSNFSFHPELYFQFIKADLTKTYAGNYYEVNIKLTSLNIPLMVRYSFARQGLQPFVDGGFIGVINIVNDQPYKLYTSNPPGSETYVYRESGNIALKQYRTGLAFGAGAKHTFPSGATLRMELRYNRYFAKQETLGYGTYSYAGRELTVMLSYYFKL